MLFFIDILASFVTKNVVVCFFPSPLAGVIPRCLPAPSAAARCALILIVLGYHRLAGLSSEKCKKSQLALPNPTSLSGQTTALWSIRS
jgi:hypothetical protein